VFTTATRAEYTGEKEGDASWDFISERQNRPRPRTKFCAVEQGANYTNKMGSAGLRAHEAFSRCARPKELLEHQQHQAEISECPRKVSPKEKEGMNE